MSHGLLIWFIYCYQALRIRKFLQSRQGILILKKLPLNKSYTGVTHTAWLTSRYHVRLLCKKFCTNMHWIIKHYTAMSILMYVHGWNPQFYSTYVYHTEKKIKVSYKLIKERYQLSSCCLLDNLFISLYIITALLWSLIFAGSPRPSCGAPTRSLGEWNLVTSWAKPVDQNNQSTR